MAGLDPAIHTSGMRGGWVYIMTNKPNGTLYIGVTNDLPRRVYQHREGLVPGFTRTYGLTRLVYAEQHEDIRTAIQRETSLKRWRRAWKVRLFAAQNPVSGKTCIRLCSVERKDVEGQARPRRWQLLHRSRRQRKPHPTIVQMTRGPMSSDHFPQRGHLLPTLRHDIGTPQMEIAA